MLDIIHLVVAFLNFIWVCIALGGPYVCATVPAGSTCIGLWGINGAGGTKAFVVLAFLGGVCALGFASFAKFAGAQGGTFVICAIAHVWTAFCSLIAWAIWASDTGTVSNSLKATLPSLGDNHSATFWPAGPVFAIITTLFAIAGAALCMKLHKEDSSEANETSYGAGAPAQGNYSPPPPTADPVAKA